MIDRRQLLRGLASLPLAPALGWLERVLPRRRVRPSDPGWPSAAEWEGLERRVGGRLSSPTSPLDSCVGAAPADHVSAVFGSMKNPYAVGDDPALTQSTGWTDAWRTRPSAYVIAAESAADVAAGVDFARKHNLRLVVKGGGHSYLGTSNAPDSLLIWMHRMKDVVLHDAFVPAGGTEAVPAVSVGAGALWMHVYQEVAVRHGRYVQGGGCGTVGVVGLVTGGGFGSASKNFGLACASLIEAEIVTADGRMLVVNAHQHPDLFWALKGGGGGTFGVVTRLTLKTHPLPTAFTGMQGKVRAHNDEAYRHLLEEFHDHYRKHLHNPHWGESVNLDGDNTLELKMVSQGLTQAEAQADWAPFFAWVNAHPGDFEWQAPPLILPIPGRGLWDLAFWRQVPIKVMSVDDRPGTSADNAFWEGNRGECGIYWHGYESVWLPDSLLEPGGRTAYVDALFAATREWSVELHFNKGLSGAPASAIAASRDTAMNPAVLNAFALAIIAGGQGPAYEGVAGHEPRLAEGRKNARAIQEAMIRMRRVVPNPASYFNETSYFEKDWRRAFWGSHYDRLLAIKRRYDPDGLFFVHHGVGSEFWSEDGFTRK